jgi:hypothetical protein
MKALHRLIGLAGPGDVKRDAPTMKSLRQESAVWTMLRVWWVVEAAVGEWSARLFVEKQKYQRVATRREPEDLSRCWRQTKF